MQCQQKSKGISPLIFQKEVHLNNNVQRQYFLKKHFKYTKNLTIANEESRAEFHLDDLNDSFANDIGKIFVLASKQLKLINNLNLSHSYEILKLSKPKLLQIMKRLREMRHLSLFESLKDERQLNIAIAWLKGIKHLNSFEGSVAIRVDQDDFEDEYKPSLKEDTLKRLEKPWSRLKRALHGKDLKSLNLKVKSCYEIIPPFSALPSTLREINSNLSSRASGESLLSRCNSDDDMWKEDLFNESESESAPGFRVTGSLQHLTNLEKLSILIPLDFPKELLSSIPDPSNLSWLGLDTSSGYWNSYICEELERFPNIKSLELTSSSSELLEKLEGLGLKHLKIAASIFEKGKISDLGKILAKNKGLTSLELKAEGTLGRVLPGSFEDFFEKGIAELSGLETLKVNLDLPNVKLKDLALKSLSNCIARLPNLKELSYVQGYKDFEEGFEYFSKTLNEHCGKLRKLEIGTQSNSKYSHSGYIEEKNMPLFYKAIKKMVNLEKLAFTKFSFFDGSVENLLRMIVLTERLRDVHLDLNIWTNGKKLTRCLQDLLEKESIEDFRLTGELKFNFGTEDSESAKIINSKELVCKRSRLRRFQVQGEGYRNHEFGTINYIK